MIKPVNATCFKDWWKEFTNYFCRNISQIGLLPSSQEILPQTEDIQDFFFWGGEAKKGFFGIFGWHLKIIFYLLLYWFRFPWRAYSDYSDYEPIDWMGSSVSAGASRHNCNTKSSPREWFCRCPKALILSWEYFQSALIISQAWLRRCSLKIYANTLLSPTHPLSLRDYMHYACL